MIPTNPENDLGKIPNSAKFIWKVNCKICMTHIKTKKTRIHKEFKNTWKNSFIILDLDADGDLSDEYDSSKTLGTIDIGSVSVR